MHHGTSSTRKEREQWGRDHDQLAEIFKTLFVEPNPVPVKHCMMRAGIIRSDEVRLPLCEMSEANRLLVEKVADATLASLR